MITRRIHVLNAMVCLGVLVATVTVSAAPRIAQWEIGLAGQSQLGYWTPVRVHVEAGDEDFEGQLELATADSDGLLTAYGSFPGGSMRVDAGGKEWFTGYVKFGRPDSGLRVRLVQDGKVVAEVNASKNELPGFIPSTADRVLVMGATLDLKQALGSRSQDVEVAHLSEFDVFPGHWYGLDGIRQVIVTTSSPRYLEGITEAKLAALQQWLRLGGELVITVGSRGETLAAPGNPWSSLLPGTFEFVEDQWKTSGLEMYAGAKDPLELTQNPGETAMTVLKDVQGRIDVYDGVGDAGQRPMLVRQLVGFGALTFVAVDLDRPPFVDWTARSRLLRRIVLGEQGTGSADTGGELESQVSHFGYRDLSGQLRAALSQFEGVTLVRFYWIVGLLLLYVILIGPLDYLLLKRWGRFHWSWVTFPVVVVLFSLLTFLMSGNFKTSEVHVNQVDIVDYDIESGQLRGTTWAYLLSPRRDLYDLSIKPQVRGQLNTKGVTGLCGWQGLPGNGLGGLDTRSTSASSDQEYVIRLPQASASSGMGTITGLPIPDASSRGVSARWWGNGRVDVVSRLYFDRQGVLQGEISNPLPFPLQECRLYHRNQVYVIENAVASGETLRIRNLVDSVRAAEAYLLRRRLVSRAEAMQQWSPVDFDISRIVEMLMFHEKAGGSRYTKMTHRYHEYLDLSERLEWNRVILVGRSDGRGSELHSSEAVSGDQARAWTYFRLVFPIAEGAGS